MSIEIDPATTALILIDLQRLVVGMPVVPHSGADVVARSAELAAAFRAQGAPVVYVRVDLATFRQHPVDTPSRRAGAPLPPAEMMQFAPDAGYQEGDIVVTKPYWGAFIGTDLEAQLRRRGISTVVIGGIATNIGVESTAREAAGLGFAPILAEDATSGVDAESHRFAFEKIMPRLGRVRSTAEILAALG